MTKEEARQAVHQLVDKYNQLSATQRQQLTEADVVHQFIVPFLQALGWPVDDSERYKYELHTEAGRPDMTLIPEAGGIVFIEAKRFGIIKELAQARKTVEAIIKPGELSLPGMATDRTREEQQAINYAFENGGRWAILTNFEKLRLFNARRDWLVLSFERPIAYLDEFDLLWQLSYQQILEGGLDGLSHQRHRADVDTDYLNFITEWREKLAQDILAHPAANPWLFKPDGQLDLAALRAVVQRVLDRLVVGRFAEDHLLIPPGTLYQLYQTGRYVQYVGFRHLLSEFYRGFDHDHNSALFMPGLADQAIISDKVMLGLVEKLYEARYRAMPADIMGNTYEQYLGQTLVQINGQVETADNLETRKKQGSYYTPQVIVQYIVDHSLGRYLYGTTNGRPDGTPLAGQTPKTSPDIQQLRVLDPACGSGSFLIYAYEVLSAFYHRELTRLHEEREQRRQELVAQGMTDPFDLRIELTPYTAEIDRLQNFPGLILETHLYGVDLDPQAAEIATVNLMMQAVADQYRTEQRLPLILNQNVKVGNGLIGADRDDARYADYAADLAELRRLRQQIVRTTNGADHATIWQRIEELTKQLTDSLNEELGAYFEAVPAHQPFHWAVEFPEVFVDDQGHHLGEAAGFRVVVGNPPWEIVKPDLREFYAQFDRAIESKLSRRQADKRIKALNAEEPTRQQQWQTQKSRIEAQANYFRQSPVYHHQGRGDTATHKLFLERGYGLLTQHGYLGFVVPTGIYTDLGTKQLREMLLTEGQIQYMFNFSNERFFFNEVHHSFKFSLVGAKKGDVSDGFWATFRFNPRVAVEPDDLPAFLADEKNLIYVRRDSLALFSPDSLSVMEFQTPTDYRIAEKIYNDWPLIGQTVPDLWNPEFAQEFHMANDSQLFNQARLGFVLYEGKMVHQFDPYFGEPRYWIEESLGQDRLATKSKGSDWFRGYRFTFRAIASATNERTLIAAVLPPHNFTGHSLWVGTTPDLKTTLYFVALLNSFCVDWLTRFKVYTNVTLFAIKQLPLPRLTAGNPYFEAMVLRAARLTCTTADFADLWQTVMGTPWSSAGESGDGPATRQQLRDELDALVAHLYNLSRLEFDHLLDGFPLIFPDTPEGQARKEILLRAYDQVAGWF